MRVGLQVPGRAVELGGGGGGCGAKLVRGRAVADWPAARRQRVSLRKSMDLRKNESRHASPLRGSGAGGGGGGREACQRTWELAWKSRVGR